MENITPQRKRAPLGAIDNHQINAAGKPAAPVTATVAVVTAPATAVTAPVTDKRRKKERLSALCKTPPSLIINRRGQGFRRGSCLGEGGFARCFQVKDSEANKIYAAKTVAKISLKDDKTKLKLLAEIRVHRSLIHPHIVRYVDCFEDDSNVYILLEICTNQSLAEMLRARTTFTEPESRFFLVQIVSALRYMHQLFVIHRDLKLGNIFLDKDMNVKIGDFGLAAILETKNERRNTMCGTPNYLAPEVLVGSAKRKHKPEDSYKPLDALTNGHSFEVDIWALGIILFAFLYSKPPFQTKRIEDIYARIKTREFSFDPHMPASPAARDLINRLLMLNPRARPTLDEILDSDFINEGQFPPYIPVSAKSIRPHFTLSLEESNRNRSLALAAARHNYSTEHPVAADAQAYSTEEAAPPNKVLPASISPASTREKYQEVPVTEAEHPDSPLMTRSAVNAASKGRNQQDKDIRMQLLKRTIPSTTAAAPPSPRTLMPQATYIDRWVDYSYKYGLAYQFSNGNTGVKFLDGVSLLYLPTSKRFLVNSAGDDRPLVEIADIREYRELRSRASLLHSFRKYMNGNLGPFQAAPGIVDPNLHLLEYVRGQEHSRFWLSNTTVQTNYKDHQKIIISREGRQCDIIWPSQELWTIDLTAYHEADLDIALRDRIHDCRMASGNRPSNNR